MIGRVLGYVLLKSHRESPEKSARAETDCGGKSVFRAYRASPLHGSKAVWGLTLR